MSDFRERDWLDLNRANWDDRVPLHAESDYYDLDGFVAGGDTIRGFETGEVGDVEGKSLLHLQCHMGLDTLSWARRGASVVGVDFSPKAVEVAAGLAKRIGFSEEEAGFVTSDVYSAPDLLDFERFDIVYTGIGALCWLPDIEKWAETAAAFVAEGGFLYVAEFHPVTWTLWPSGNRIERDYFDGEAMVEDEPGTYTDGDAEIENTTTVEFQHTMGDVISAVAATGLRLEFLHEHDFTLFQAMDNVEPDGKGLYRPKEGEKSMPLMYSFKAVAE
ncbi:class I SAM-dependent methyltransferase [Salininema proteolyticum]|uniref:Class I SAM-dependent methyltransferase n=1 Tax=Salininema proteolyticum TaxID=1607685 RepID=A0ABV8TY68_9ACTN